MKPLVDESDIEAVSAQMRSFWIGRGVRVAELETLMCEWVGAKHCVALASGTAAVALALMLCRAARVSVKGAVTCEALSDAAEIAEARITVSPARSDCSISVYPEVGGDIEDFARHLPKKGAATLQGRYGVFSFGALKDVSGGLGGCLVSNEPIACEPWKRAAPLSDINAAMILSQLARYEGHATERLVAGGKAWRVAA